MNTVEIIPVDESNVDQLGFYCYRSKKKTLGYQSKLDWLKQRFRDGLRIKLLHIDGRLAGFIEYMPAESAWRVLTAPGYLVVHCVYTMGRYQGQGFRSLLVQECIQEAKALNKAGVAVVVGESTFLPGRDIFEKNAFSTSATAMGHFELLHKPLNGSSIPSFPTDWPSRLKPFQHGFHVIYTPQCPYNVMYLDAVRNVGEQYGIPTQIVELTSSQEIQRRAPTPVGVYALIHDGEVILHHPTTEKDLLKLMEARTK
jgi:GNAT superfamily N-acetyltransferase